MTCRRSLIRTSSWLVLAATIAGLSICAGTALAVPPRQTPKTPEVTNEAAIRASAVAFAKAFDRGDAKALAAMWTAYGSVADDEGEILKGRTAIEDKYAGFFKAYPGAKIVIAVKSVEFPATAIAIEDGITQISVEHAGPPVASRYTAFHVLVDGKWLMASVRESRIEIPSNYSKIERLGWLVGTWKTQRDGTTVNTTIRWIANKSFLQRDYTIRKDAVVTSSGTQIIGWDPKTGQVRSWSFDSSGGHGTGLWSTTPQGWQIESSGTLPDGTPTASRDLLIRVPGEDNVLGWRSVQRKAGQVALPDTPEVVLDRVVPK